MKVIGARAGDDVGGRASAMAKFRAGGVGKNAEFGDGIDRRFKNEPAVHTVEVVRAIDEEIV